MHAIRNGLALAVAAVAACVVSAADAPASAAILEDLKDFRTYGTVLHVAAHPDDENTTFITAMAKGRHFRTAYLSVTRGDGGQNEIGPELDALLGLARTQELLAARRIDGGRQYFTRALDFGYSKTVEETMEFWGREAVLGDVVRVIRTFKPDVIVNNFAASAQAGGGHGNHNASAILALDAFKLAGDPTAYPEHLQDGLAVWQPKRILQGPGPTNLTGTDPVTGETFAAISARSRAMHHTQGFGINTGRGGAGGGGAGRGAAAAPAAPAGGGRGAGGAAAGGAGPGAAAPGAAPAGGRGGGGGGGGGRGGGAMNVLAGDPATTDIMEGIDTTWARIPNGGPIGEMADEVIAQFKPEDPSASVPALLAIRSRLAAFPRETILDEKRALLDRIIQNAVGLTVETIIPQAEIVPGDNIAMKHTVTKRSGVAVRWVGLRYPSVTGASGTANFAVNLSATPSTRDQTVALPATTRVSQPYWLREQSTPGLFVVPAVDRKLIGMPENPPVFPVEMLFDIGGQTIVVPTEPVQITTGKSGAERRRRIDAISPVTVHFTSPVKILPPGGTGPVTVELTANRAGERGALALDLPAGWRATPASQNFQLGAAGSKAQFTFQVTGPSTTGTGNLGAHVTIGNQRFNSDRYVIDYNYDHIPLLLLQPTAIAKAVTVDLKIRGQKVGYVPGSGDDVAECLEAMGYTVTRLTGADLTPEKLAGLDAVVLGVRVFNERTDFAPNLPALLKWVEEGGTVVTQYNRPNGLITTQLAPYPLSIQGNAPALRVTKEEAPVTILSPDHPAVTVPNRITPADFNGWVQERGAYFASSWDADNFKPIFAMNDPGENPLQGSLLVAQHGKGYYVYSGIGFFRQLPKGVPGAYRLFANLVSLGK